MALVVPGAAQVRLIWGFNGNLAINVLGAVKTGGVVIDQARAEALGTAIKAAFTAQLAVQVGTGSGLIRVGVRDVSAPNLPEFFDTGGTALGTGVGDPLPASVAQCITLRTGLSGKRFTGRVYLGGFVESANDPNGIQSTTSAAAGLAFLAAVDTAMAAQQLPLAVLSRPANRVMVVRTEFLPDGTENIETLSDTEARSAAATDVIAMESRGLGWETQRRRINGRGALPSALQQVQRLSVVR